MDEPILDCLIVGGGPAGLTAAIYLARFHLDILVVDGGKSRAAWIPCTRNHAGFPDGISGQDLLDRMKEQACKYGATIETEFVTKLERDTGTGLLHPPFNFALGTFTSGTLRADCLIGGTVRATFTRQTPGAATALRLRPEGTTMRWRAA